jgi:hypothetical protein
MWSGRDDRGHPGTDPAHVAQIEAHAPSSGSTLRFAITETSAERPALTFNLVVETRDLARVEQLRLGPAGSVVREETST